MATVKKYGITIGSTEHEVTIIPGSTDNTYTVKVGDDSYTVTTRSIELDSIVSHILGISGTEFEYTGSPITPYVLTDDTVYQNTDYTVEYADNTEVGTGTVTINGAGLYQGSVSYTFTIKSAEEEGTEDSGTEGSSEGTGSDGSTDTPTESESGSGTSEGTTEETTGTPTDSESKSDTTDNTEPENQSTDETTSETPSTEEEPEVVSDDE